MAGARHLRPEFAVPNETLYPSNASVPFDVLLTKGSFTPDALRCDAVPRGTAAQRVRCERTLTVPCCGHNKELTGGSSLDDDGADC